MGVIVWRQSLKLFLIEFQKKVKILLVRWYSCIWVFGWNFWWSSLRRNFRRTYCTELIFFFIDWFNWTTSDIQINGSNCLYITCTFRKITLPPLYYHQTSLPTSAIICHLGQYIDKGLTWNPHTGLKRQEMNTCYRHLKRLLDYR